MTTKRKRRAKEPVILPYYFLIESFEAASTYSVQDPRDLSRRESDRQYDGERPNEPVAFTSVDLEMRCALLEPRLDRVRQARIDLAVAERRARSWPSGPIGLLGRTGDELTTYCSIAATSLQALLTLLCAGRQAYICLDSEKLRYRKAPIHHLYWYTGGHTELEELIPEWATAV